MKTQERLLSLDVFRGATIAAMILVNTPGSFDVAYPQLRHAAWHGWTLTDWIFPFFLWIVGVAMTFSFAKRMERGESSLRLAGHVVRRAAIIFALGLVISGFPFGLYPGTSFSFSTLRIPGVLQRIALCSLGGGLLLLWTGWRVQAVTTVLLLALYAVLLLAVPVPGYGAGVLQPVGNIVGFVDSTLLSGHTWEYAPAAGFDPEGILSTIPAVATLLSGVLAGHLLRSARTPEEKSGWLFLAGFLSIAAGWIADAFLPINKNLWTSSYVLFTSGWAMVCCSACYWVADVRGYRWWTKPFIIFGTNAIVAFMLSELVATAMWVVTWPDSGGGTTSVHEWLYGGLLQIARPIDASLLFAVGFVLAMYGVAFALWKWKIFVRI
jgi:predicted acyltransferase